MATRLPKPFADLEVFVADWSLATQREREQQRSASSAGELTTLYQVLLPRLDAMLEYLNQYELAHSPQTPNGSFISACRLPRSPRLSNAIRRAAGAQQL